MSPPRLSPPIDAQRVALPLSPDIIRATVPEGVLGAYCIYRSGLAVYVGRSDHCVRRRLLTHAASGLGTHFAWQFTEHMNGAFLIESLWYHKLVETGHALNLIHPARPVAEGGQTCPICDEALQRALSHMLHKLRHGV